MSNMENFNYDATKNLADNQMMNTDRFVMHPNEVQMVDLGTNILSKEECKQYIEKEKIENTIVSEELNVGDVVMLKDGKVPFTITATKNTTDTQGFDYYGQIEGSANYYLFDQQDIKSVIEVKGQHLR